MISQDSVIATKNYFVTIDKINGRQEVRDAQGYTMLEKVLDGESYGILIETRACSIVSSPTQIFQTASGKKEAKDLTPQDWLETVHGPELLKCSVYAGDNISMSKVLTQSGQFIANGFHLYG